MINNNRPVIAVGENSSVINTTGIVGSNLPHSNFSVPANDAPVSVVGVTKSQVRPVEMVRQTYESTSVETFPATQATVVPSISSRSVLPSSTTNLPITTATVTESTLTQPTTFETKRSLKDKILHRHPKPDTNDGIVDSGKLGYPGADLYTNPGLAGVETYREGPANLLTHKATNQTHFNEPILDRAGPGYTNGDIYDRPGFAGVENHHQGPIDKLAAKIVGMQYSHEPLLDRAYVEPQNMGPIDKLAHKLVDHKMKHTTQPVLTHPTQVANGVTTTTTTTTTKTEVVDGHQGIFSKLKNKMTGHTTGTVVEDKAIGGFGSDSVTKY